MQQGRNDLSDVKGLHNLAHEQVGTLENMMQGFHLNTTFAIAKKQPSNSPSCCSSASSQWRLELFYKSGKELHNSLIPFLKENGIKRINITNKTKEDDLMGSCRAVCRAVPGADVCVHYSLKWNYHTNVERSYEAFRAFCRDMAALEGQASVMLVSGGGKKRKLDTVGAMRMAQDDKSFPTELPLYVCFNPYFPDKADLSCERCRLEGKLKIGSGLVRGIYLQMGSDLQRLEEGLQFLNKAASSPGSRSSSRDMQLFGSIFLPTKRLLAQMKYRPWNGVFLSDEYLSGIEAAEGITASILKLYHQYGVKPLIESNISSTAELRRCHEMLERAGGEV